MYADHVKRISYQFEESELEPLTVHARTCMPKEMRRRSLIQDNLNEDVIVEIGDDQQFDITNVVVTDRMGDAVPTPGAWSVTNMAVISVAPKPGGAPGDVTISANGQVGTAKATYTVPLSAGASISRSWFVTVHAGTPVMISATTSAPRDIIAQDAASEQLDGSGQAQSGAGHTDEQPVGGPVQ